MGEGPEADETEQELLARRAAWQARRARREERREQNVSRAAAMRKARLAFERESSTREPSGKRVPARTPRRVSEKAPQLWVGCSGWFYWHWRDDFYPSGLPTSRWFEHYARRFRTVELNAPFYSWPTVATVQGWVRQLGRRRFVYAVKVNEMITHVKRFAGTRTLVRDFYFIGDLLGPRLGCFLFQLPPSFRYTPGRLKSIVGQLDPSRPNVVEFRHRSWWNPTVYAAFRRAKIVFCSCSGPRLPEELVKTADDVYVRFHGTTRWYRHDYTKEELAAWAKKIRGSGAKRVWVYFNNDREGYAIKNARELIRRLRRAR